MFGEWRVLAPGAFASLSVGAHKTGIATLRHLLPKRPADAATCCQCSGTGWLDDLRDAHGEPFSVVCRDCAGLGWTAPSVALGESVIEAG